MTGREFKANLINLGISQAELARRLNVRPSTVSDWVNGPAGPSGCAIYVLKLLNAIEELKEAVK